MVDKTSPPIRYDKIDNVKIWQCITVTVFHALHIINQPYITRFGMKREVFSNILVVIEGIVTGQAKLDG